MHTPEQITKEINYAIAQFHLGISENNASRLHSCANILRTIAGWIDGIADKILGL